MENIFYILFGWLLGLLGPRVIEIIQRHYRRSELRQSILIELQELRSRLAVTAYLAANRSALVDHSFLDWIMPILQESENPENVRSIGEGLKPLRELTNEQLKYMQESKLDSGKSISFKKYSLPFIETHLSSLSIFSPEFQRMVLDVRAQLETLHEEIDLARFYFAKTFESLTTTNDSLIKANLDQAREHILIISRNIVDKITLILSPRI